MRRAATLLVLALVAPGPALAHEVLHDVERGRAIAVRAYFADGEALAYAQYEVYSPTDRDIPYQKGRTDRSGWVAFVPDVPGSWRVKVVDSGGHGLDLEVDAASAVPAGTTSSRSSTAELVLRPLAGVAAIAAVFGGLLALHRRRRAAP